jgi:hypothetical protein
VTMRIVWKQGRGDKDLNKDRNKELMKSTRLAKKTRFLTGSVHLKSQNSYKHFATL